MPTMTRAIAFVATSKPDAAITFYRDVLGLTLLEESQFALVFDAFGTMLRVQKASEVVRVPYTSFGLEVPEIEQSVRALRGKGVRGVRYPRFEQDELDIWTAPSGARVFWFHDPDGNLLSLTQF
jgi:catechol 2,3-dioxygenase-like lactoylglutathione lyase family enzyme